MPKRRKSTLWVHKPKQRRFPRFVTPKKNISATATPRKKKQKKHLVHLKDSILLNHYPNVAKKIIFYANPSPKNISENITYDEVEETTSETSKEYIDIAEDKKKLLKS